MSEYKPIILLVDDTPLNLDLLLDHLEQENFRIIVAESGASTLERLHYVTPDIILLDIIMPDMDGFTTCRHLKANPMTADIPVIFLTSLNDTLDKVRGFAAGGVDYITKPLQVEEVLARVNTHLTIRRLQKQLEEQNELLEQRVRERTVALQEEVKRRRQNEIEKSKLLDVVGQQSEQLREMTNWLIASQQKQHANVAAILREQVMHSLTLLTFHLQTLDTAWRDGYAAAQDTDVHIHLNQALALIEQTEQQLLAATTNLHNPTDTQRIMTSPLLKLSTREREVLQLVVEGKTNTEIAELLSLTETTVRTYRSRIMQKLALDDLPSLIKFAIQHGLTTVDQR